jgi:hypothetical protein
MQLSGEAPGFRQKKPLTSDALSLGSQMIETKQE